MTDTPYFVGADIGGTNVKLVAVTRDGLILLRAQFPTRDTEMADWATGVLEQVFLWGVELGEPAGIGVASPGLVTSEHRSVSWMQGRMERVVGFDWTAHLRTPYFVPVINDAQAALLGESWLGAAKGARNVFMLTLGTGVGGAAIVDGRLLQGHLGRAGHLGHISLNSLGLPDIVGTPGSLEDMVGEATLCRRSGNSFPDSKSLVEAVRDGQTLAVCVWRESLLALAAGIVSLINILDPEIVVLGGGIAGAGPTLFGELEPLMKEIEWRPFGANVPVVPATLGELAGAIGAARFAMTFRREDS
jgi:glucokinase